jgi:hypothetical protein
VQAIRSANVRADAIVLNSGHPLVDDQAEEAVDEDEDDDL